VEKNLHVLGLRELAQSGISDRYRVWRNLVGEIGTEPIRFWLITFKKPETDEEFYAVVLSDGTIVEPQDEEDNLKSRQTYFAAWQRDRMNAAAVAKYIRINAMVIRTCTVTLLSILKYYIKELYNATSYPFYVDAFRLEIRQKVDAMESVSRYALLVSQRMPVLLRFRGGRLVFRQAAARSAEQILTVQELLRITMERACGGALSSRSSKTRYWAMDPGGLIFATGVFYQGLDDTGSRMPLRLMPPYRSFWMIWLKTLSPSARCKRKLSR